MRWLWTLLILGVGCSDGIQAGRTLTDSEDADGDGFSVEEDCDDADAAINPAALEVCNGVDDNCDGRTDADDATLTDGVTGYADRDGDGFGDPCLLYTSDAADE